MDANEIITIISKVWCSTNDLRILSGLGYTKTAYYNKI